MKSINRKDIFGVILVAVVTSILLRLFVFDIFIVKGDSMTPTIKSGDVVVVNRLAYVFETPKREDIIVVIPRTMPEKILKRVIGLPNERVEILGNRVVIKNGRTDNGEILREEYLELLDVNNIAKTIFIVDPREYFILGDNRYMSVDSRELGPVDDWKIKGRVFLDINLHPLSFKPFSR